MNDAATQLTATMPTQQTNSGKTENRQQDVAFDQLGRLFQSYIQGGVFKDTLATISVEGIVLQLNKGSKGLLGYKAEEVIGQNMTGLLAPESNVPFLSFLRNITSSKTPEKLLCKAVRKDGKSCHLRFTALQDMDGNLLAICEELTEVQASGTGKKATEQILQALLDNSFDMLALIDEQGNYVYVSESFYDNFEYQSKTNLGYRAMDIVGTNCFNYMHPDDLPRIEEEFKSLFGAQKKVYSRPFRFKSASGEWRWVEAVVTNQLDNQDIEAVVVSCRDVTLQIETERQLKELQLWEAVVNGEEKERSRIAKDLHDGVAGMLVAARMHLASLHTTEKGVTTSEAFNQAIQLLEDAAVEVRKTSHNLMPEVLLQHGLDEALRRYCANISNSSLLVIRFDVWGERKRFKRSFELSIYRIVQELLNNAVKHAHASEVLVQYHCDGTMLYITVEDNGIGISSEQLQNGGTGLQNLRARVHAMNGTMTLSTAPQQGVSADISFPVSGLDKTDA